MQVPVNLQNQEFNPFKINSKLRPKCKKCKVVCKASGTYETALGKVKRWVCPECGTSKAKNLDYSYLYSYTSEYYLSSGIDYISGRMSFVPKRYLKEDFSEMNKEEISKTDPHYLLSAIYCFLDNDNHSDIERVWFLGKEFSVKRVNNLLLFSYQTETLFSLQKMKLSAVKKLKLNEDFTYFYFNFYGKFFALSRLGLFNTREFLNSFVSAFGVHVTRLDYCFDFSQDIPTVKEKIHFGEDSGSIKDQKTKEKNTYYWGSLSPGNKKAVTRLYNKTSLVFKNGDERFYPYVIENPIVSRVEFEFRSGILNDFDFQTEWIFQEEKLVSMVKSYSQSKTKFFDFNFDSFEPLKRIRKASKDATLFYFTSRIQKLWNSARDCEASAQELVDILEKKYLTKEN